MLLCTVFLAYFYLTCIYSHIYWFQTILEAFCGHKLYNRDVGHSKNLRPFTDPVQWSKCIIYELKDVLLCLVDQYKLEKQYRVTFNCFVKIGTIFAKHLIVLARILFF